jgi:hypothetical protein
MSKLSIPIRGKKLMERWNIDAYELLQIMKEKELMPLGSYNTQVEVARLYVSEDVPKNYEQLLGSLQLPWSFVEEMETDRNFLYPKTAAKYESDNKVSNLKNKDEQSLENFINSLKVIYENDSQIKIQRPGKKAKTFNYTSFGFKNSRTKQWKTFLKLLQDPVPLFNAGPAGTDASAERKNYDSKIKLLKEINIKLIKFLNQNYSISVPLDYKLYKKCPEEGSGVYKFKFFVKNEKSEIEGLKKEFEEMPNDDLIKVVKVLADKFRKTSDNSDSDKFIAAVHVQ